MGLDVLGLHADPIIATRCNSSASLHLARHAGLEERPLKAAQLVASCWPVHCNAYIYHLPAQTLLDVASQAACEWWIPRLASGCSPGRIILPGVAISIVGGNCSSAGIVKNYHAHTFPDL